MSDPPRDSAHFELIYIVVAFCDATTALEMMQLSRVDVALDECLTDFHSVFLFLLL